MALTVSNVSAIIAAASIVIRLFIPTALALMIAGLLKEESTAATWSAAGTEIHSSHWPTILRAEPSQNIDKPIKILIRLKPLALAILIAASVVTPLGLYDDVLPSRRPQQVPFPFINDTSPFGYGTPQRSNLGFNRHCGSHLPTVCPGSDTVINFSSNATSETANLPYGYNARIPQKKADLFQSGLAEQVATVSSIFDIQWRSYTTQSDPNINNGSTYLVGNYRQLKTLILDDTIEAVEGLLVNTVDGGIAFRNHTIPENLPLGASWSENLLFLEPDTQCVNTNLTLDFSLSSNNASLEGNIYGLVITDRGGFANLNQTYPYYNRTQPELNPDLAGRAYKGAWLFNVFLALYLNVTRPNPNAFAYINSNIGKTFPLEGTSFPEVDKLSSTDFGSSFNDLFDSSGFSSNSSNSSSSASNPFSISESNFTDIAVLCQGASELDYSNISNIAVGCGILYGAARREDGSASLIFEPDSRWSMPMFSCATGVKASIKEAAFLYNGTQGLKSLTTLSIADVNPETPVTWGVENNQDNTLGNVFPLWGLVSASTKESSDLSVRQSPYLYLPGLPSESTLPTSGGFQNLPGVDFYNGALSTIYDLDLPPIGLADYTGQTNLAMYAKWQTLSTTSGGAATIMNLVWTDIAANAVLGTRSWLPSPPLTDLQKRQSSQSSSSSQVAHVLVNVYSKQVRYHWLFAIPAGLALLVTVVISVATIALSALSHAGTHSMRRYLYALSPGRILASFVYPNECDPQAPTKVWARSVGAKKIALPREGMPTAKDPVSHPLNVGAGGGNHGYGHDFSMTDPLLTKNEAGIMMQPVSPNPQTNGYRVFNGRW